MEIGMSRTKYSGGGDGDGDGGRFVTVAVVSCRLLLPLVAVFPLLTLPVLTLTLSPLRKDLRILWDPAVVCLLSTIFI